MNAKDLLHLSLDYDLGKRCNYFTFKESIEQWENIERLHINLKLTPEHAIVQCKDGSGNPIDRSRMPIFDYFFKGHFLEERGGKFYNKELYDEIVSTVKLIKPIPLEKSDFLNYFFLVYFYKNFLKSR